MTATQTAQRYHKVYDNLLQCGGVRGEIPAHCKKIEEVNMKKSIKIIALLLAFLMLMALFGACAKKKHELEGAGDINDEDMTGNTQTPANTTQNKDIPENEFTGLMPQVNAAVRGVMDNDFGTTVIYEEVSADEFAQIVQAARNLGFTVEPTEGELQYIAKNESGMFIQIQVLEETTRVSVYSNAAHLN